MTKLSVLAGVGALLLGVVPALAYSTTGIKVTTNTMADSNTGANMQYVKTTAPTSHHHSSSVAGNSQTMTTGAASSAAGSDTSVLYTAPTPGHLLPDRLQILVIIVKRPKVTLGGIPKP